MPTKINYCIVKKKKNIDCMDSHVPPPSEVANQRLTGVLAMISSLFAASRTDSLFESKTRRGQRFWIALNDLAGSVIELSGSSKCALIEPES